ncbi:MAG: hypothetical protein ACD_75C01363G0005, partial [uncultured bacterium]
MKKKLLLILAVLCLPPNVFAGELK